MLFHFVPLEVNFISKMDILDKEHSYGVVFFINMIRYEILL